MNNGEQCNRYELIPQDGDADDEKKKLKKQKDRRELFPIRVYRIVWKGGMQWQVFQWSRSGQV